LLRSLSECAGFECRDAKLCFTSPMRVAFRAGLIGAIEVVTDVSVRP
jgi:hypothetical protein